MILFMNEGVDVPAVLRRQGATIQTEGKGEVDLQVVTLRHTPMVQRKEMPLAGFIV